MQWIYGNNLSDRKKRTTSESVDNRYFPLISYRPNVIQNEIEQLFV